MKSLILLAALALAACGVDGPPERPVDEPSQQPGVTVSGEARFGVVTEL